jgi:hypothetical protein
MRAKAKSRIGFSPRHNELTGLILGVSQSSLLQTRVAPIQMLNYGD